MGRSRIDRLVEEILPVSGKLASADTADAMGCRSLFLSRRPSESTTTIII